MEQNANFMEYVSNFEFAWVKERKPHSNLHSNYINRSLWSVQVCMRQKHKTQETSLYLYPGCFILKQPNYELKYRYELRGLNSAVWQVPYACAHPHHPGSGSHEQLFRPYWGHQHGIAVGSISGGKPAYQRPFTAEASAKHSFKWASVHNLVVSFSYWEG